MGMDEMTKQTKGTENWTPRQWAAYEALMASVKRNEAARVASFSNATPKGGWTEADRVAK